MRLLILVLLLQADEAAPRLKEMVVAKDAPVVKLFVPGFEVRELPVALTNITNLEYADDGRLFAAGYDGRLHVLRDTDGDGLEDKVTTFHEKTSDDYSLGIQVRADGVYVMRRHAVMRYRDTNGDGVPNVEEIAATGWRDPEVDKNSLMTHRRVDDALGLAIAPDGSYYVTMGAANYSNGYLVSKEDGQGHVDLTKKRGCVLKLGPDGKNPQIVATGVRFIVCMQINRHGDLFGTDQEGATWLPNGNPFDELLHLQPGRHYGFPPRHPKYLPQVFDEPSVFDYAPQHQSTCGFRFNEPRAGRERFGPPSWDGDAFITAMSRGKLYRTQLVKTAAGYVARNQLLASVNMLPVDAAFSPKGDLVIACHSGAPDWGSGPKGAGKLFKISWKKKEAAQPLFVYASGPGETAVVFDRPLDPTEWKDLAKKTRLESGPYVTAGDRFERFRPGYQVVKDQQAAPRWEWPILSGALSADHRSVLITTSLRDQAMGYALSLSSGWGDTELAYALTGVEAEWKASDGSASWKGWLPHLDLSVSRAFTKGSTDHDRLWALLDTSGRLMLKAKLDLKQMLQPVVQQGSTLGYEYPAENVRLVLRSGTPVRIDSGEGKISSAGERETTLDVTPGAAWIPVTVTLATGEGMSLLPSWSTSEDPRPRALPLRRLLLPWARPSGVEAGPRIIPEIAGGRWVEGKKIFNGDRAVCFKCHTIRGEGGKIGPDLSNLVHRDYDSVLKDVLQPSAAINPDYLSYTVRLKSGDVLAGIVVNSTPETLVFGTVTGETVTVPRAKVEVMEPSKISLMPENLLKDLTAEQLRDLMTFLLKPAADSN